MTIVYFIQWIQLSAFHKMQNIHLMNWIIIIGKPQALFIPQIFPEHL